MDKMILYIIAMPFISTLIYILFNKRSYKVVHSFDVLSSLIYIILLILVLFKSPPQLKVSSTGTFLGMGLNLHLNTGKAVLLLVGAFIYLISQVLPSDGETNWRYPGIFLFFTLSILSQNHFFLLFSISAILFFILIEVGSYLVEERGEELYRTTLAFAGLLICMLFGFGILAARGLGLGSGLIPFTLTKTVSIGVIFTIIGSLGLAGGSPLNSWFSLIRERIPLRLSIIITNLLFITGGLIIIKIADTLTPGEGLMGAFIFASISLLGGAGSALTEVDREKYIRAVRGALIGVIALIAFTGFPSSIKSAYILLITASLFMVILEYLLYYKMRGTIILKVIAFLSVSTVPLFAGYNQYIIGFANVYGMEDWQRYPFTFILILGLAILFAGILRFFNNPRSGELKKDVKIWYLSIPALILLILPFIPLSYGTFMGGITPGSAGLKLYFYITFKPFISLLFSMFSLLLGVVLFITLKGESGILYRNKSFFTSIPVVHWLYYLKEKRVFSLEVYIKPATKAVGYAMFVVDHIIGDPQRFLHNLLKFIVSPIYRFISKEKR